MPEVKFMILDDGAAHDFHAFFDVKLKSKWARLFRYVASCVTVRNQKADAMVDTFLVKHSASLLQPWEMVSERANRFLVFSKTGEVCNATTLSGAVMEGETGYTEYIQRLRGIIGVKIPAQGDRVEVIMDPLPVNAKLAIFSRVEEGRPWSIAYAHGRPKLDYLRDLIKHDKIKGLPAQLSIYEFADGTQILARNYLGRYEDETSGKIIRGVHVAALYTRDAKGNVCQGVSYEDFFAEGERNVFVPAPYWLEEQEVLYGKCKSFHNVGDVQECKTFVGEEDSYCAIYKTEAAKFAESIAAKDCAIVKIVGLMLQDNRIQNDKGSILEPIFATLFGHDITKVHTRALMVKPFVMPKLPIVKRLGNILWGASHS